MGKLTPLQLAGPTTYLKGLGKETARSVIRLRDARHRGDKHTSDFALVRSEEELEHAAASGWQSVFAVGEQGAAIEVAQDSFLRVVCVPQQLGYLAEGDVLGLRHASKRVRTLYRKQSKHNSFLVTERCNNYCLMCSQPPKDIDDRWLLDEISECLPLVDPNTSAFTFTGGEPLSDWSEFIKVLERCRDALPATSVQVLTNGRAFANSAIVDAWRNVKHPSLMAAIPVYASVDYVHDHVVQAVGAFDETVLGILKMKDRGQRVEVRVVLHALTAPIIAETCSWIARNLPFVDHVALMGLENTGFAIANDSMLWIDPMDYQDALANAIDHLVAADVKVSIYNLPRCVLHRAVWPYAVQSISDWKNGFVAECERCHERQRCSGFFTTGRPRFSRGIAAIR